VGDPMRLPEMTKAEFQKALEEAMFDYLEARDRLKLLLDSRKPERILKPEDST